MERNPRGVEAIVDRQVRQWEARRLAARKKPVKHKPLITVSRSHGARGGELARAIAKHMGFDFWDQQLVHELAEHAHLPDAMLASLDEHRQGMIKTMIDTMGTGPSVTEGDYLKALMRVVHTMGDHGQAVIVGRGAHYVLPPESALRIRVDAPIELRVRWLAEREGIDNDTARREINRIDRERTVFMRAHYDRVIDTASDFDLMINTATLPPDNAVPVIAAAYRGRFGDPGS